MLYHHIHSFNVFDDPSRFFDVNDVLVFQSLEGIVDLLNRGLMEICPHFARQQFGQIGLLH